MKIRIYSSDPNSTTAFYRSVGPLRLHPEGHDVQVFHSGQTVSWSDFIGIDILFMDRPDTHNHYSMLKLAQSVGCRVVIDWDINPFAMSEEDHPLFWKYTDSQTCQVIKEILIAADGMIVENDAIAKAFAVFNDNLFVRRNQYFREIIDAVTVEKVERDHKLILVPSIYCLQSDLDEYRDTLVDLIQKDTNTQWIFTIPPHYKRDMRVFTQYENVKLVDQLYDPVKWVKYVRTLQPDIVLAPMKMNRFNASRYNNVSLDAFYAGGMSVCPDYLPYRYRETDHYTNACTFKEAVSFLLHGPMEGELVDYGDKYSNTIESYQSNILPDIFAEVAG